MSLRTATDHDIEAIASFTSDTFTWGDYVATELPYWLEDPEVEVVVATDERDHPVALARVRMLGPKEGWLSAARVHPDHRRQGLGSRMNDWCVAWVAERGGSVARLQIETGNEPAHNQVLQLGYRPVASALNAERSAPTAEMTPATNGGRRHRAEERLDRAPRAEAEGAYIAWSTGELARVGHGLFPVDRWAWRRLTPADVGSARTWYCPSGWIMAEDEEADLTVRWVVCGPEEADRLLRATVDLAQEREAERVHVVVPDATWIRQALKDNGFELFESRIYEKPT